MRKNLDPEKTEKKESNEGTAKTIEVVQEFTEEQKRFMQLVDRARIDPGFFKEIIPEIQFEEPDYDSSKPTIAYIHTGGTLAMAPSEEDSRVLSFKRAIDLKRTIDICDLVAQVRKRFNIIGVYLCNIDSKEVKNTLWPLLAATVNAVYKDVEGVVIGHGTHTLEYTAAAIAFAMRNPAIPIVLTASQIPIIGHCGSDGLMNLTGAMEIAANGDIAEVVAFANGTIFRGSRVNKKNDKRLDVFESRVIGPIGYFTAAGVEPMSGARSRKGKRKHELVFRPYYESSVLTLKQNPSMVADHIAAARETRRILGIILETYGSGAIPKEYLPVLREHISQGFPIFLTSSCAESGVSPIMEQHDEDAIAAFKMGVRTARDMTTTAATVKLMNILGNLPTEVEYAKSTPEDKLKLIEEDMVKKSYAGEVTTGQRAEDY